MSWLKRETVGNTTLRRFKLSSEIYITRIQPNTEWRKNIAEYQIIAKIFGAFLKSNHLSLQCLVDVADRDKDTYFLPISPRIKTVHCLFWFYKTGYFRIICILDISASLWDWTLHRSMLKQLTLINLTLVLLTNINLENNKGK